MALSKNAKKLLSDRYCRADEQPYDVFKRVSTALSLGDQKFGKRLNKLMRDGKFLPNSPCLRNAGLKKGLLHACFVLPVKDNMESLKILAELLLVDETVEGCVVKEILENGRPLTAEERKEREPKEEDKKEEEKEEKEKDVAEETLDETVVEEAAIKNAEC